MFFFSMTLFIMYNENYIQKNIMFNQQRQFFYKNFEEKNNFCTIFEQKMFCSNLNI